MAVAFLEGGTSPIPMQMASTTLHRGPGRRVCQFANCRKRRRTNPQAILDFLAACVTKNYYQKITMINAKTNNPEQEKCSDE
jgi:hypothetical protein